MASMQVSSLRQAGVARPSSPGDSLGTTEKSGAESHAAVSRSW